MNINILQRALDASSMRQQVITNNMANADTPYYKAQGVAFEDLLKQHLADQTQFEGNRTDPRHVVIGKGGSLPTAQVFVDNSTVVQNNGNNVDMDAEMTRMGKNALWYYTLTEQLNSEFQQLSIAIKGRG